MDIVVFMQTPSSGQMYLIPSCWEYQTLPAHSSVHQWLIPLGTVDCFVQVSTPFPGSNPQLTTGYWEDTKTQFPCFNLGQLQRSLSDLFKLHRPRCQLQSHCRSAAPSAQSCLPAFLTRVPPEHSSINLLQAVLCFRVCLQRTQYKTVSISTNEQWSGVITGWLTPIVPQDSWPLNKVGSNCMASSVPGFSPTVNTTLLHDPCWSNTWMWDHVHGGTKYVGEMWIQRPNYKSYVGFLLCRWWASLTPALFMGKL